MTLADEQIKSAAVPAATALTQSIEQRIATLETLADLKNTPIIGVDRQGAVTYVGLEVPEHLKVSTPNVHHCIEYVLEEGHQPHINRRNIVDDLGGPKVNNHQLRMEYVRGGDLRALDYMVQMIYGADDARANAFRAHLARMATATGAPPINTLVTPRADGSDPAHGHEGPAR
jgi:hypothetical protein